MNSRTLAAAVLAVTAVLGGCATVDFDYPKPASHALAPESTRDTPIGRRATVLCATRDPGVSGFHMLPDAIDALAVRLLLAEHAEATIDAQYYLIKPDEAGLDFIEALLAAADRGVRVRVLVDDMFMSGHDGALAALDAHDNLEIRVFNPFASRSARFWDAIWKFRRVNRRMHNKSFTVDSQVTVVGGRNIADEYFGSGDRERFGDLDVIGIGPIVMDVSRSFDAYWNHERAAPIPAFADVPDDPRRALEQVRALIDDDHEARAEEIYEETVTEREIEFLEQGSREWTWAPYTLLVDDPDKSYADRAEFESSIGARLLQAVSTARSEALLISPYFVPLRRGTDMLLGLAERGVDVTVITNSLASNNQFAVHAGYAPSRKQLLRQGIALHEIRPDARFEGQELVAASGAKSTLHTKAFVVDREDLFIGSFNFDPRSAYINTELGVIIHSPELAARFADSIRAALPESTWEVELDGRGRLTWRGLDPEGAVQVSTKEPETSWWDRAVVGCLRMLPIRGQL